MRDHLTDIKIVMVLEIVTVPGAFAGAVAAVAATVFAMLLIGLLVLGPYLR